MAKTEIEKQYRKWFVDASQLFQSRFRIELRKKTHKPAYTLANSLRIHGNKNIVEGLPAIKFVDQGVHGNGLISKPKNKWTFYQARKVRKLGSKKHNWRFRDKMPPFRVLRKYGSSISHSLAIGRSIQQFGLEPKEFIEQAVKDSYESRRMQRELETYMKVGGYQDAYNTLKVLGNER